MLKIRPVSDLHINFSKGYVLPKADDEESSVLIITGDLCELWRYQVYAEEFFDDVCSRFREVLYLFGNHCYWYNTIQGTIDYGRTLMARNENLTILYNKVHWIDDVMFYGGTLWTNLDRWNPMVELEVMGMMNDFECIQDFSLPVYRQEHESTVFLMREAFKKEPVEKARKKVILTHHAPTAMSIDEAYSDPMYSKVNFGYYSDLTDLVDIIEPDLWLHGHVHSRKDYKLMGCRFFCNPRGYQRSKDDNVITEYTGYDPKYILEI